MCKTIWWTPLNRPVWPRFMARSGRGQTRSQQTQPQHRHLRHHLSASQNWQRTHPTGELPWLAWNGICMHHGQPSKGGHMHHPQHQQRTCTIIVHPCRGSWLLISPVGQDQPMNSYPCTQLYCSYCNKIDRSQLDCICKDTTTLADDIKEICSNGKDTFSRSWIQTRKIRSVWLSIKDHKPIQSNGQYPTCLIVSVHTLDQCLSKLASK
jgi:hypothetical protein